MSVFDAFAGLPLHPLAVHAVVVLLPITALAVIAVALRPSWRAAATPVTALAALMVVVSFVARQSGSALQSRLSALMANGATVAADHGRLGSVLPLFAAALFLAALFVRLARTRPALNLVAVVVAVVVGLATVGWTVVVGDTGARAVWGSTISSTSK
jgi:hypothetical protein